MIQCPQCHAPVAPEDADPATGLARCRACDEVFRLAPQAAPAAAPGAARLGAPPPGITLADAGPGRTLHYRWFSSRTVFITIWSVAWILAMRYGLSRNDPPVGPGVRALLTGFLLIGIWVGYWAMAEWVNTTTFSVGGGYLRVRHGPLPWAGATDLPAAAIRQLYAHDFSTPQSQGGDSHRYSVRALLHDGSTRTLASNLKSPVATRYVEHCLETWLRLADEPVAGEMARRPGPGAPGGAPGAKLACPRCRQPVGPEDADPASGRARCASCGADSPFAAVPEPAPPERLRPRTPQPPSVTLREGNGALDLSFRWFWAKYAVLAVFCAGWDKFLWDWYADMPRGRMGTVMLLFPGFHVAIGVAMTYAALAGFVNHTSLRAGGGWLTVRHGPLPWSADVRVPTTAIQQIYSVQQTRRGRGTTYGYDLFALLRDGTRTKLVASVDHADVALFLEERLEAWMKIADQPVEGEFASR